MTLVRSTLVKELVSRGAKVVPLQYTVEITGVGDGKSVCREQLQATCKFQDGVTRTLLAYIVELLPYDLLVGVDFMTQQCIGFQPDASGDGSFLLFDASKKLNPVIYNSSSFTEQELPITVGTQCNFVEVSESKPKKLGKKGIRKYMDKWKHLSKEDQELIQTLASVRVAQIPESELQDRLSQANISICGDSTESKRDCLLVQGSGSKVKLNKCDFPEYQSQLEDLVNEYIDIFSSSDSDIGKSTGNHVNIRLNAERFVHQRNYRTPIKLRPILKKLVYELLDAGVLEKCESSQFNSPCLLVPKKAEHTPKKAEHVLKTDPLYRLVVDYRQLNKIIENVVYPIPRIQDIFVEYKGCKAFSSCDIRHAFFTIALSKQSRHLTAFSCELGKFQFKFLPQGLKISPSVFQAQIEADLAGLVRTKPYMDDILGGDPTPSEHLVQLRQLFARLRVKGYKLKLSKCSFLVQKVSHLGMDISEEGLSISDCKIRAAQNLKVPTYMSDVKSLLGFTSFLRDHVPYYCDVVGPIQDLLSLPEQNSNNANSGKKSGNKFDVTPFWKEIHQESFEEIKRLLTSSEVLAFPDSSKPYILWTDASKKAMSAVLMQNDSKGNQKPLGYWAKSFKGSQLNWSPLVKEARAVLEAVQHYSVFVTGCQILLKCDHKPLAKFLTAPTRNEMVNRWSIMLQEFDIEFEWVDSASNISDCLSRLTASGLFETHCIAETDDFPAYPATTGQRGEQGVQATAAMGTLPTRDRQFTRKQVASMQRGNMQLQSNRSIMDSPEPDYEVV